MGGRARGKGQGEGPGGRARGKGQGEGPGGRARGKGQGEGPGGRARGKGQGEGPGGRARGKGQGEGPGGRARGKGQGDVVDRGTELGGIYLCGYTTDNEKHCVNTGGFYWKYPEVRCHSSRVCINLEKRCLVDICIEKKWFQVQCSKNVWNFSFF